MNFNDISKAIHLDNIDAGWWDEDDKYVIGTKFALIHSEVSEAFEGFRKDSMDDHLPHRASVEVEFADTFIRLLDLAGRLNLDLDGAISEKLKYNKIRLDHKKQAREAVGGKKF